MTSLDKEWEISQKDEKIKELREALNGTIREIGSYSPSKGKWEINYSSILTKLIQEAGRWTERYASDLFLGWEEIDEILSNPITESTSRIFAFREAGVDGDIFYEHNKSNPHYYRAVWKLEINLVDVGKIEMVLMKVKQSYGKLDRVCK